MTALPSALPAAVPAPGAASAAQGTDHATSSSATAGEEQGFHDLLLASLPDASAPAGTTGEELGQGQQEGVVTGELPSGESAAALGAAAVLAPIPVALAAVLRVASSEPVAAPLSAPATTLPAGTEQSAGTSTPVAPATVPVPAPAATAVASVATTDTSAATTTSTLDAGAATSSTEALPLAAPNAQNGTSSGAGGQEQASSGLPTPAPSAPTAPSTGGIDVSALTSVQGAAAVTSTTASTAPNATPAPVPATPVAQQVMPEVTRLVQRGDGTHRVTLTLSPEALGDVQVTLTLVKGAVTVSFAAADLAQRALMESAPELRRLLELTGAQETRILVRDQNAPVAGASAPSAGQEPGEGGTDADDTRREASTADSQQNSGRDAQAREQSADLFADLLSGRAGAEPQNQHARMRDELTATDGNTRGTGVAGSPLDPATETRTGRVDVTA